MRAPDRDGPERLLGLAVGILPPTRTHWGAALRAELGAIESLPERRRFARGAAWAALREAHGRGLVLAATAGLVAAVVALIASRVQLTHGGPGLLAVTVPVPAIALACVAFAAARRAGSIWSGVAAGLLGMGASLAGIFAVLALDGHLWMDRRGVFMLDADPPRGTATAAEVVLDLFATGMWAGHLAFWAPLVLLAAVPGALSRRRPSVSVAEQGR